MSRWELMAETRHILVTVFVVAPNYTCIYCLMIFYHKRRDIFLNVVWTGGATMNLDIKVGHAMHVWLMRACCVRDLLV